MRKQIYSDLIPLLANGEGGEGAKWNTGLLISDLILVTSAILVKTEWGN
jgi:hypothetical protein